MDFCSFWNNRFKRAGADAAGCTREYAHESYILLLVEIVVLSDLRNFDHALLRFKNSMRCFSSQSTGDADQNVGAAMESVRSIYTVLSGLMMVPLFASLKGE